MIDILRTDPAFAQSRLALFTAIEPLTERPDLMAELPVLTKPSKLVDFLALLT